MISRKRAVPAVAAEVEEWHRGGAPGPTLAAEYAPDLSAAAGYSLADVRYNCVGLLSPAQARLATRTVLWHMVGIGVGGALVALMLANGSLVIAIITLLLLGRPVLAAALEFHEVRAGHVAQVDGDIWTEVRRDPESADRYVVHIGDLRLEITDKAYRALTAGGPYRIFYLPRAKRAIGGQVLPSWRPAPQPWRPAPQPAPTKVGWWGRTGM